MMACYVRHLKTLSVGGGGIVSGDEASAEFVTCANAMHSVITRCLELHGREVYGVVIPALLDLILFPQLPLAVKRAATTSVFALIDVRHTSPPPLIAFMVYSLTACVLCAVAAVCDGGRRW
jgi:hypothetical protein